MTCHRCPRAGTGSWRRGTRPYCSRIPGTRSSASSRGSLCSGLGRRPLELDNHDCDVIDNSFCPHPGLARHRKQLLGDEFRVHATLEPRRHEVNDLLARQELKQLHKHRVSRPSNDHQLLTTRLYKPERTPSEPSTMKRSRAVNSRLVISGVYTTPTSAAMWSPKDRDIARPGYGLSPSLRVATGARSSLSCKCYHGKQQDCSG